VIVGPRYNDEDPAVAAAYDHEPVAAVDDHTFYMPVCLPLLGEPCGDCHRCTDYDAPEEDR
jgi:hypothetical protein